ncbi:MAG TPA: hypothetical protein VFT12_02305 [Thermoanaerobaculia bacterium]|nr:hypothetical protein [Thermoanaerobaculia bacterium]
MSGTTRREFARTIATAGAALPVVAADTLTRTTEGMDAPPAMAIALAGVVSAQSGRFLDAGEMQQIYDNFKDYVPFIERLRDFKLKNGDEPDFTFHSLVERW